MGRLASGNLQTSLRTRDPVINDLGTFAPATLELALAAAVIAGLLGVGLGLALAAGGRVARLLRLGLIGGASVPTFLLALLMILLFYSKLHLLPASGRIDDSLSIPNGPTKLLLIDSLLHGDLTVFWSAFTHILMPAFTLALLPALAIARTLATSCERVMREDYVRTARSKGLRERTVLIRHGLRNASGPALTMSGLQFGLLLGGIVVVEQIFAWPGLGRYLDQSIAYDDFPAITGTTLLLGTAYVIVNFLVDLAQAWADPGSGRCERDERDPRHDAGAGRGMVTHVPARDRADAGRSGRRGERRRAALPGRRPARALLHARHAEGAAHRAV